ncbi:MAG: DnaA/Hda family protein [Planctomycetes bacterium]|nr:DnaA/Hda family protein [Planctomycetota bacterium]
MLVPLFRRSSLSGHRDGHRPGTRAFPLTEENRHAVLAAREAAANPGGIFNPLLLLGPPRAGKSGLLAALAADFARQGLRPCLLRVRELGARFVRAARRGRLEDLTLGLLGHGALLLDEAERFAGRERLCRTSAAIVESFLCRRSPVAAASRLHPRELPGFDPRLAALLDGGFRATIGERSGRPTLEGIAADTARRTGVEPGALRGRGRSASRASARGEFVLAALEAGFTLPEVGRFLGDRSVEAVGHLAHRARARVRSAAAAPVGAIVAAVGAIAAPVGAIGGAFAG